jgi:hypothetical protein
MKLRLLMSIGAAALFAAGACQLASAATPGLPAVHRDGNVAYLSGGVGSDESTAIKAEMHNYPLVLEFAGKSSGGNEYLADIPVQIADAHGKTVLNATSRGPFMLVKLPGGHYTVTVRYNGNTQHRAVEIAPAAHAHETFLWSM